MKMKKLLVSALASTFILGVGYTSTSAEAAESSEGITPFAVPVDASISPLRDNFKGVSSKSVTKNLSWGAELLHIITLIMKTESRHVVSLQTTTVLQQQHNMI